MLRDSYQTIFKRTLALTVLVLIIAADAWSANYTVLYEFDNNSINPSSGLITDAAGNVYGTTLHGGHNNFGSVYELSPTTGYHLLYAFSFSGPGGISPQGNLVFDSDGNLYGTTLSGGANKTACGGRGCGVVFKLSPSQGGGLWTETVLYNFCSQANCADGANPQAGVIFDSTGNLYGTTKNGGVNCGPVGCGTVFELQNSQSGWTESVLYSFNGSAVDGTNPLGSLVFDGAGNLYGTAQSFTVFQLSPTGNNWVFSVIYQFGQEGDGVDPMAGLVFEATGNLYGTTALGGQFGFGTAFELTPSDSGSWTEMILWNFGGGSDGSEPQSNLIFDTSGSLYGTTFAGGGTKGCNGGGCGTVFKLMPQQDGQWKEMLFRFPIDGSMGKQPSAPVLLDSGNVYGTTTAGGDPFVNDGVMFRITQ